MIEVSPQDSRPLWAQIRDALRDLVATGALPPASAVPSVREMAQRLRVNPATVAKAYRDLTDEGLLTVQRGEGTFVADLPAAARRRAGRELLASRARELAACARALGLRLEEACGAVEEAWTESAGETEELRHG